MKRAKTVNSDVVIANAGNPFYNVCMWFCDCFELYMRFLIPSLLIGFVADLIFGDPYRIPHPVRLIGALITMSEKGLRAVLRRGARQSGLPAMRASSVEGNEQIPVTENTADGENEQIHTMENTSVGVNEQVPTPWHLGSGKNSAETAAGLILVLLVLFCTTAITVLLLLMFYRIHWIAGLALQSYMCYTIPAAKSLRTESMKVYTALREEDVEAGRRAVSMIVGRDTDVLDTRGVIRAATETVAENTSDGVVAPLFYLAVGGPVVGFFYKAVNTMDSMVGYKNEKYRYFGTAAARLDDALNFLPSRISAVLMIAAVFILSVCEKTADAAAVCRSAGDVGGIRSGHRAQRHHVSACGSAGSAHSAVPAQWNAKNAARIWKRDRRNHASPNSAQTEAVMAGALGVQLAGDAWYFGEKHEKPTIGDDLRPPEPEDIPRANRLMYAAGIMGLAVFVLLRLAVFIL